MIHPDSKIKLVSEDDSDRFIIVQEYFYPDGEYTKGKDEELHVSKDQATSLFQQLAKHLARV